MTTHARIREDDAVDHAVLESCQADRLDPSRREVLQVLGVGLLVSVADEVFTGESAMGQMRGAVKVSDRLHVGADGIVTVMTGKVEVGQGSRTEITQAAAEELRVAVDRVRLVMGDTDATPDDGITAGSRTTPSTIPAIRKGAAAAREALIDLAGRGWKADRGSLTARDGKVIDAAGKREIGYGALVADKALAKDFDRRIDDGVSVTRVEEWRVLGTPVPRIDAVRLVTGAHRYPSDMTRPGMLYGAVLRGRSYGATLKSIDLAPARAMEGVRVVRDGGFVGCAAPTSMRARAAVEAIGKTAQWERPAHPSSKELFAYLKAHARSGESRSRRRAPRPIGSVKAGLASAKQAVRAAYQISYIAHAPLEPRAALAEWGEGKVTVWTGSQAPFGVHGELARVLGLSRRNVRVIVPDTGGGFGGKHSGEVAVEAARIAKGAGCPVLLRWTREEEFTWAYFRPAGLIEIEAGLDGAGRLVAWDFVNYNSGGAGIGTPYDIVNVSTRHVSCDSPLRQGSYRALAATANNFAREAFMDELAYEAKVSPLEFRLKHLKKDRLRAVLEAAARRFDWDRRAREKRAPGRGIGLSCGTEKGSYTAACVEVEVDREKGRVRVLEVCEAFECGAIMNPANLRSQVEGCIIMGMGGALREAIEFEGGRITNAAFSRYPVPRFEDAPKIETVFLNRRDLASVGAGETPIIAIAPAAANAVFDATGRRARSMPIRIDV
ncbi:MAG: xanthine dehydrogenase family protein molybdopterin-binding subunit [Phycisphaerae bacterium]|nr:xanthine dehydrogenase family protein molybdopterin-binding subunit [Phycisphaerae bacterium]